MSQVSGFGSGGGGSGITTIDGDTGSITGSTVSIIAGTSTPNCGSSVSFSNSGTTSLLNVTDSNLNTIIGKYSGSSSITGQFNYGYGEGVFDSLSSGSYNVAMGYEEGGIETGSYNTTIGANVSGNAPSGSYNTILGYQGDAQTPVSNNIYINANGVNSESNTIRIGTIDGQTACYIAGIEDSTVTGNAVFVSSSGQLGLTSSSQRFKKNIQDMSKDSEKIYDLRPVTFDWKQEAFKDPAPTNKQFGLIAEEVKNVFPELVLFDKENNPRSVNYNDLIPMLLNEVQKLKKEITNLKSPRTSRFLHSIRKICRAISPRQ